MKKFSIIIATFNAADTIGSTLESIRSQWFRDFELIVVDGDSKDGTLSLLRKNTDLIDHLISEPDEGLYDAWNKGIGKAQGEWILFIGAGDRLYPGALRFYADFIGNTIDADYVSARIYRTTPEGKKLGMLGKRWRWQEFRKNMTVAHVGSLHHYTLFREVGLFDHRHYHICADYELLLRKKEGLRALFMDQVIGETPIGGISFSKKALLEKREALLRTGGRSRIVSYLIYLKSLFLLKSYRIRHLKR